MKDIMEFVKANPNTVFRFLVYNKFNIWTPEQQANKYIDECIYTDTHYSFAKITDCISTPEGVLLELSILDEDDFTYINRKEYRLLKDIILDKFDIDNKDEHE